MKKISSRDPMTYGTNPMGTSYIEVIPETYIESEMLDTEIGHPVRVYEVITEQGKWGPYSVGRNALYDQVTKYLDEYPVITPDPYDPSDHTCFDGVCGFRFSPFQVRRCHEKCTTYYVQRCPNRKEGARQL